MRQLKTGGGGRGIPAFLLPRKNAAASSPARRLFVKLGSRVVFCKFSAFCYPSGKFWEFWPVNWPTIPDRETTDRRRDAEGGEGLDKIAPSVLFDNMANALVQINDDLDACGPAMRELDQLQRNFVRAYFEYPAYNQKQLALAAGYSDTPGNAANCGYKNMHNEKVIAAINEETSKRLRGAGAIGVMGIVSVALNPAHKDHFKACEALANRTGFHALSEHKVIVDDKRPQTKRELVDAIKNLAAECGLSPAEAKKLIGGDVIEAEFQEVKNDAQPVAEEIEEWETGEW